MFGVDLAECARCSMAEEIMHDKEGGEEDREEGAEMDGLDGLGQDEEAENEGRRCEQDSKVRSRQGTAEATTMDTAPCKTVGDAV